MKPYALPQLLFVVALLSLGACTTEVKETPAPVPEKDPSQQVSDAIELKADETSATQLSKDSDENDLVQLIEDNQESIRQLRITLKVAEKTNNPTVAEETKADIRQRQLETETKIAKYYKIIRIPFIHINNYKLLPKALERLEARKEQLCNPDYKTIIYGYGGYIGSEKATKTISHLRAKAVSNWLKKNSTCKTLTRGLGIDIRAREIQDVELPKEKHDALLEESRYVRIYIHR